MEPHEKDKWIEIPYAHNGEITVTYKQLLKASPK